MRMGGRLLLLLSFLVGGALILMSGITLFISLASDSFSALPYLKMTIVLLVVFGVCVIISTLSGRKRKK